jgi:hypothetical protein
MRTLILLSLLGIGATNAFGQAQPAPAPAPRPAQPAQPAPATPAAPRPAQPATPRRAQPATTRSGMAITVTDPGGGTLGGVRVQLLGATERRGETNGSGQVNFPGLQAGTYRLRFSGDEVITFEREVTLRGGQIADVDVTLNPAPPAPQPAAPPPAPAAAPAPQVGPTGMPLTLSVPDTLEKNFVGSQPRRETMLSCSGNTRTTMIQLNMPLPDRLYDTADAVYYVVGGEGTVRIAGRDTTLATNGYVSIPRGTLHSFTRTGRRPMILLAVLSGTPCEEPR